MIKLTAKHFDSLTKRDSPYVFPAYSKPILNIATQNGQATRINIVGSMKELFTEFLSKEYKTVTEWETFYTANGGVDRIERATDKLHSMLNKMPVDHAIFSRDLAKNYIIDLVIYKTHFGMSGEYYAVLATAKHYNMALRWSNAAEESQGIDAWLDNFPVQVKPHDSHKVNHVRNHADTTKTLVITYESKKDVCYVHNPEFINK